MRSMNIAVHTLVRPCPLCRSNLGSNLGSLCFKVFDNSPITGNVSLVSCDICGFAFYDTTDTQADFDRYYKQNAYYCTASTTGSGGVNLQDTLRFEALFHRFAPYIPGSDAAIFDIGCARGGLLSIISNHGFTHLYGVDMLAECVEHVKDILVGVSADLGTALELPFPEVLADVLIYSHVVEHVINLSALVAAAHEKLSDNGILYVEVPDASRYGEYTENPYQDLYLEHVNHFQLSTLTALFESGGFKTVTSGRFLLEAVPAGHVPCVWVIFRKGAASADKMNLSIERHLRDYIRRSEQHQAQKKFAELARAKTPLFLWGISQYAMLLLGQTPLGDCDLRGFVDKDPSKRMRTLLGRPIEPPEILRHAEPDCAVLVTAPGYEGAIASALDEMDFRGMLVSSSGEVIRSKVKGSW